MVVRVVAAVLVHLLAVEAQHKLVQAALGTVTLVAEQRQFTQRVAVVVRVLLALGALVVRAQALVVMAALVLILGQLGYQLLL
jgi:hypothetical protein